MKMYVKPSISVIELQLKENIAAVPTTVYRGKKSNAFGGPQGGLKEDLALSHENSGLTTQSYMDQYGISIL